jgi:hypothetical protein
VVDPLLLVMQSKCDYRGAVPKSSCLDPPQGQALGTPVIAGTLSKPRHAMPRAPGLLPWTNGYTIREPRQVFAPARYAPLAARGPR